jgi:hypothetical protein
MGVFTSTGNGNGKQRWTKEQDALLVKLANEGKSRAEISKAVTHPENSITYRVRFIKAAEAKLAETVEDVTTEAVLNSIKY